MSKTSLKKELAGYSKEQLIEVVLDLYESRKEVKEYFNFFLNPDSKKLFEKYQKAVYKEFARSKWGRSKARISVIKKLIKEFCSFHPDAEYKDMLYLTIIRIALQYEQHNNFSDTLYNGIDYIVGEYLAFADRNEGLDKALDCVNGLIQYGMPGSRYFKNKISEACRTYIESKSI